MTKSLRSSIALAIAVLASNAALAQGGTFTSPAEGSRLTSTSATFYWTQVTGAGYLYLYYGNQPWAYRADPSQTYLGGAGPTLTAKTVAALPSDGRFFYVSLVGRFGDQYTSAGLILGNDYRLLDANWYYAYAPVVVPKAVLSSPAPGSPLASGPVTFAWNNTGSDEYWLSIGSSLGSGSHYSATQGRATSVTVSGLPTDGRTLYVRLSTRSNGVLQPNDYTVTAYLATSIPKAELVSPLAGSTLPWDPVSFEWTATGATEYWLSIGSSAGGSDLYSGSQGTATSRTVSNLPADGRVIYVRLGTRIEGWFQYVAYTFTASSTQSIAARIVDPANGSTLDGTTAAFSWDSAGASEYSLTIGNSVGSSEFYSGSQGTQTSRTISNLPADGRTLHVRLRSRFGSSWWAVDHTFVAWKPPVTPAAMTSPIDGSTFASSLVTFSWTNTGATQYRLHLGNSPGATDLGVFSTAGTSYQVSNLPTDGREIHVQLGTLIDGTYQYASYRYLTFHTTATPATIASPANGSRLGGTTVTFYWNSTGADEYSLRVGWTLGGAEYFSGSQGLGTSQSVSGLPSDGRRVYARLMSRIAGAWQSIDHAYDAVVAASPTPAVITSPANNATVTGSSATFQWTSSAGATQYYLYVGTTGVGSYNLYAASQGLATSRTIYNMPRNGYRVYVRIWTLLNGSWQYRDFQYTSN